MKSAKVRPQLKKENGKKIIFLGPLEGKLWVHSKWANGSIVGETKLKPLSNQL